MFLILRIVSNPDGWDNISNSYNECCKQLVGNDFTYLGEKELLIKFSDSIDLPRAEYFTDKITISDGNHWLSFQPVKDCNNNYYISRLTLRDLDLYYVECEYEKNPNPKKGITIEYNLVSSKRVYVF